MIICMVIRFALFAIEQIHLLLFCFFYFHLIPSIHHWLDDQLYCYLWICLFNSSWIFYAIFSKRFYTGIGLMAVFAMESSTFDCRYDMLPFVSSHWGWPIGLTQFFYHKLRIHQNIDCPPAILFYNQPLDGFFVSAFFSQSEKVALHTFQSILMHFVIIKGNKLVSLFDKSDQFETISHLWVCGRALFSH